MGSKPKTVAAGLLSVALLLGSASAQAGTAWTWQLNGSPSGTNPPTSASVTGYADTGNNGTLESMVIGSGNNVDKPGTLNWWGGGGYGICSDGDATSRSGTCTSPEHAIDNYTNRESLLLSFGSKVNLSWIDIGWGGSGYGTDSDISVLAYTGTGTPTLNGSTYGSLLGHGWSLVGNYRDLTVSTSSTNPSLNLGTTISSSYWLIGAYNQVFGGSWNDCFDAVKIYSVGGTTSSGGGGHGVPEPSGLVLLGIGVLAMVNSRRRKQH